MHNHAPRSQVVVRQHLAHKSVAIRNRPLKRGLALLLLSVCLALMYVWVRIQVIQLGYETSKLRIQVSELEQSRTQLEADLAGLMSPDRLEQVAEQVFRMHRPNGAEIVYVPIVNIESEAHAQVSDRR